MALFEKLFSKGEKQAAKAPENLNDWQPAPEVPFEPSDEQKEVRRDLAKNSREVDELRAEAIFGRLECEGDALPLHRGEEPRSLDAEFLKNHDLGPYREVEHEGVAISFSKPFWADKHEAIIGYTENADGKMVPRGYYRSTAGRGLWQLLPDYVSRKEPGQKEFIWYGKGYSDESLTLPLSFQGALDSASWMKEPVELPDDEAKFAFFGTGQRYDSMDDYLAGLANNEMRNSVYREVAAKPILDLGVLDDQKMLPENCAVKPDQMPDFRFEVAHWNVRLDADDEARQFAREHNYTDWVSESYAVQCFDSADRQLRYAFRSHATRPECCIDRVESLAPLTSTGLRAEWVAGGDLCTPIYQEKYLAGKYGDPDAPTANDGQDVNMWKNYISRIPMMTEFYAKYKDRDVIPNKS